jgi:lysophospholipase L1-like esterase
MQRHFGRVAATSSRVFALAFALAFALYACGSGGDTPGSNGVPGLPGVGPQGSDQGPLGDGAAGGNGDIDGGHASNDGSADAHPADAPLADAALPPGVRFVGRDTTDPLHPRFGWSGARIIAHFTGTDVTVTLDEHSLFSGPSRWDVLVDGSRTSTLAPANGTGTYPIATGLAAGEHTIELYKRTEGNVGDTQFLGFTFPNGGQLLSQPPAPARRIEFLGDSMTDGFGDECASASETFSGGTQNERLAFSGLVAHDLGADHHNVSYSGRGVLLNYTRADTVVFDQYFPRTMATVQAADWIFTSFSPDVVWITLGANDWDKEAANTAPPDLTQFTNKYIALAALVRSKYSTAHVFCSIAPSINDDYPVVSPGVSWNALTNMRAALSNVIAARASLGDTRFYAYEFTRADQATDMTGCAYHPNLALHRKMANEVIAQIKAKTSWP